MERGKPLEADGPESDPSSCQTFWGNSLTSSSLSFLICQTEIMRKRPSPVVECLMQGQRSVNVSCHPTITFILYVLILVGPAVTSQRLQITQARSLFGPRATPPPPHCPFNRASIQTRLVILLLNSVWNPQVQMQRGPLCK